MAHEYAKVRWLYTQFDLADKTEIEYFNGGHTIRGKGTFKFLHRHLNLPERNAQARYRINDNRDVSIPRTGSHRSAREAPTKPETPICTERHKL